MKQIFVDNCQFLSPANSLKALKPLTQSSLDSSVLHSMPGQTPDQCNQNKQRWNQPFGEASNKGPVSTFGGVSTSDSEECRPCALDVAQTNAGEMSDGAAAAEAASFTATTAGNDLTQRQTRLGLLNDFRKFDYQNFLSFSFLIYINWISFPILRCATVLTYRDRPFTALTYRRIRSPPIGGVIIISSNLTPRVKQADGSHWQIVRTKWGRRRRDRADANCPLSVSPRSLSLLTPRV